MAENDLSTADALISSGRRPRCSVQLAVPGRHAEEGPATTSTRSGVGDGTPSNRSTPFAAGAGKDKAPLPTRWPVARSIRPPPPRTPNKSHRCRQWIRSPMRPMSALDSTLMPFDQAYPVTQPADNGGRRDGHYSGTATKSPAGSGCRRQSVVGGSPCLGRRRRPPCHRLGAAGESATRQLSAAGLTPPRRSKPPSTGIKTCQPGTGAPKPIAALDARSLMEQADGLLRWGDNDEAERLASRAASMQVSYRAVRAEAARLAATDCRHAPAGGAAARCAAAAAAGMADASATAGPDVAVAAAGRGIWSVKAAKPLPPANWIGPRRWRAKPNNCGCPTRPLRRAKIGRGWSCSTSRNCGSGSRRAWCRPADNTCAGRWPRADPTARPRGAFYDPANDPTRNVHGRQ